MRWRVAHLYGRGTGRDALGNPVGRTDLGEAMVRMAPWGAQRTENAGNGFYDQPLTVVTPKPLKAVKTASQAVISGITYSVEGVSDLGRMRSLSLRAEKGRRWADSG